MVKPVRPDIPAVLARWHGESATVVHVRDGANAVYRFAVDGTPRILRLSEAEHRSRDQLEAELDFVRFAASRELASHGLAVARPVASVTGAWVETVVADNDSAAVWHAVVFEKASGRHFEFFSPDIDRPLFHAWGRAMGALHAASREFEPTPSRRRASWTEQEATRCDAPGLPSGETTARREHARVMEWLAQLPVPNEHRGLIHGDFERTNFVLDGYTLRLYDFDDACYHWYLADIAHALWVFRGAPPEDRRQFLEWFLEGYRERSAVDDELLEDFSWFVRLRSLALFLGRIRRDAGGARRAVDGVWEQRMRAAFEEPYQW